MNTGAIEMRQAGRKSQAVRSGRGNEAVEYGHSIAIEGIQDPPEGVRVELPGSHAGRNQSGGRLVLEEARHEGERLVDTPQFIEPHRFDRFTHGEVPQFRILLGGLVDNVANAEFVEHASHTVRGLLGHNHPL
jgi:hypothetical protein